jgi:hypothetical protein
MEIESMKAESLLKKYADGCHLAFEKISCAIKPAIGGKQKYRQA